MVLVPPGPAFVAACFALLGAGGVPVLVDPGIGVRRVRSALAEVAPSAFVGSHRAQLARRLLRLTPTVRRRMPKSMARSRAARDTPTPMAPMPVRPWLSELSAMLRMGTLGTARGADP